MAVVVVGAVVAEILRACAVGEGEGEGPFPPGAAVVVVDTLRVCAFGEGEGEVLGVVFAVLSDVVVVL